LKKYLILKFWEKAPSIECEINSVCNLAQRVGWPLALGSRISTTISRFRSIFAREFRLHFRQKLPEWITTVKLD
jgi:hypothetical protein